MRRLFRWLFGVPLPATKVPVLEHMPCGHPLAARSIRSGITVCWACDCAAEERAR